MTRVFSSFMAFRSEGKKQHVNHIMMVKIAPNNCCHPFEMLERKINWTLLNQYNNSEQWNTTSKKFHRQMVHKHHKKRCEYKTLKKKTISNIWWTHSLYCILLLEIFTACEINYKRNGRAGSWRRMFVEFSEYREW